MIGIRFKCGHSGVLSESFMTSPVCRCGETQIVYVQPSRAPRFTGACTGPHAEFRAVDPAAVNVAPSGPLSLKEPINGR